MADELKSCPFCGTEMKQHDHCFAHPRPEDGDCVLRHYSFDKTKAGAWNTRTETQSQATIDELVGALKVIRHQWAGHSEACALILQRGQCDCDWPAVAAQCDDAIAKAGGQS